ncbi:cytochrome b/b6 domain-containing protein [Arthrobacter subterraneus]|uniref:cytochrome b/b6 domain-containing protein n=1 Tax=Arthrobacter subterraneus TaxID=335973 RepID=UPI00382D4D63
MATYGRTLRRGLPRRSGGEPWPPADAVFAEAVPASLAEQPEPATATAAPAEGAVLPAAEAAPTAVPPVGTATTTAPPAERAAPPADAETAPAPARAVRRGLPRVLGGEPWPAVGSLSPTGRSAEMAAEDTPIEAVAAPAQPVGQPGPSAAAPSASEPTRPVETPGRITAPVAADGPTRLLRRGLPRVPGGDPWPPETVIAVEPVATVEPVEPVEPVAAVAVEPSAAVPATRTEVREEEAPIPTEEQEAPPSSESLPAPAASGNRHPLPAAPARPAETTPEESVRKEKPGTRKPAGPRSRTARLLVGAVGLLAVALAVVFFTRWFVTLGFMQDFLVRYPGETPLPEGAQPGFPAWVQWQHFFNFFLIVLIIRSGLQVRRETRPPGYWTPKWSRGDAGKISITLWFHQALDILWLLNGLVFVVLLFVTGHWVRLVPTTWEVFPNALSALIQYVSLDWPTENGWVNYNSLQMLAYFVTVFVAAPLAAVSGARMSGLWPKKAATLNRAYPVEWARAIHFPVMLYFVVFIIGHVALVFATGALRNLNHMYGGQDAVNWTGFWIFFVSLLLVAGAWLAARPVVLAPIAGLSGRVSSR